MICKQCGHELHDGALFCANCGAKIVLDETAVAPDAPVAPIASAAPPQDDLSGVLSKLASSPLFLIAAISYTLTVVLNLISMLFHETPLDDIVRFVWNISPNLASYIRSFRFDNYLAIAILCLLLGILPGLLTVAGIWTAFGTAKARKKSITGLSIIRMVAIITLIASGALFAGLFIMSTLALSGGVAYYFYNTYDNQKAFVFCLVLLIVMIAAFVLGLIYFIKTIKTLNVMRRTIADDYPAGNVSLFVAVIQMLIGTVALYNLGTLFSYLPEYIAYAPGRALLALVQAMAAAAAPICFGLFLFLYHARMKEYCKTHLKPVRQVIYIPQPIPVTPVAQPFPAPQSVQQSAFPCPQCGKLLPYGADFCGQCGTKLDWR